MTFVVTDICINCKYTDCVEVCPVDCFYEGENMLVIHPDECIDCGVCEPECPIDAILPDSDEKADEYIEMNRKYSIEASWPVITIKKDGMGEAEKYKNVENKYPEMFSEAPGEGD
jgi:ferredoxin